MLKLSLCAVAMVAMVAGAVGCADPLGDAAVEQNEDDLLKRTSDTAHWSYRGLMPRLESPSIRVSLSGHTIHVTGKLPDSYTDRLPFYAKFDEAAADGLVHLVYPLATANEDLKLEDGSSARNPEPFTYSVCGGDNFHATNDKGDFGGFPFIEYVCGHRDRDGRWRSGIAFHGPISSARADGATYWSLRRGPVSHACNRMLGEHVLELAHVIGFDKGAKKTPVTVIDELDSFDGRALDVDYPATGWTRPDDAVVFPIWQAVKLRDDGSTALDFPQWACDTARCASMPPNARDPYTGEPL